MSMRKDVHIVESHALNSHVPSVYSSELESGELVSFWGVSQLGFGMQTESLDLGSGLSLDLDLGV